MRHLRLCAAVVVSAVAVAVAFVAVPSGASAPARPGPGPPPTGPGPASTGVPAHTPLTPSGSVTVRRDGTVLDGLDVRGSITVAANDVVIRRARITTAGAMYGIRLTKDAERLRIVDTEIAGSDGRCVAGVVHARYAAQRLDVSGCVDGLRANRDTVIEDSWVHDLRTVKDGHNDAVQTTGGSNIRIAGNRLEGRWQRQTSAILVKADLNAIDDVEIVGNHLSGGTYTLYVLGNRKAGFGPPANVSVRDNVFSRGSWKFGSHDVERGPGFVWENNVRGGGPLCDLAWTPGPAPVGLQPWQWRLLAPPPVLDRWLCGRVTEIPPGR